MKRFILSAALGFSTLALASTWEIDTAHASANFTVKHFGVTNVNGTLGPVTGTVQLDDKDITKSKIEASIDATKLDTKWEKRDNHLKSADFFEVAKFPTVTFKATKVEKVSDTKLKITGDLTMHGVTKPVVLDADVTPAIKDPFSGKLTRAVAATGQIIRQEWGLKWQAPAEAVKVVGDEVKISIEAELHEKKTDGKAATN